MWKGLYDFLCTPICGSFIGILGLSVSIWSLIETRIVKKYVAKERADAVYLYKFTEAKKTLYKQFDKNLKSLMEIETINKSVYRELMVLIQKILNYSSILEGKDVIYLEKSKDFFKNMAQCEDNSSVDKTEIIDQLSHIMSIISKGEYVK